jgi:hypothetical protein
MTSCTPGGRPDAHLFGPAAGVPLEIYCDEADIADDGKKGDGNDGDQSLLLSRAFFYNAVDVPLGLLTSRGF